MPEIYASDWYQAMVELANSRDDLSKKVPKGEYKFAVELEGDGRTVARITGIGEQPLHDVRQPFHLGQRDVRLLLHRGPPPPPSRARR